MCVSPNYRENFQLRPKGGVREALGRPCPCISWGGLSVKVKPRTNLSKGLTSGLSVIAFGLGTFHCFLSPVSLWAATNKRENLLKNSPFSYQPIRQNKKNLQNGDGESVIITSVVGDY